MLSITTLALAGLLSASSAVAGIAGKTLRISAIGDSITEGVHDSYPNAPNPADRAILSIQGGYRGPLLNLLNGNTVNMVGANMDGNIRDWNHEGWGGHSIAQLLVHVNNILFAAPNVMLIYLGVNNIYPCTYPQGTSEPGCPGGANYMQKAQTDISNLLNQIHRADPTILIIVGLIGGSQDRRWDTQYGTSREAAIATYNNYLRTFVSNALSQPNSDWHITTANIHDKLATVDDVGPALVHPTEAGYVKMAQGWKDALDAVGFAYDSWYVLPRRPSNFGQNVCPTTTSSGSPTSTNFDFSPSTTVSALATGQPALYFGVKCEDAANNQCSCTDLSQPSPTGVLMPSYRSCLEMSTVRTPAVIFADINGDGRDDYLYVSASGAVSSWLTIGSNYDTVFGPQFQGKLGAQIFTQSQGSIISNPPSTAACSRVRFADLNGDGFDDYLVVEPSGQVTYFQNNKVFGSSTSSTQDKPSFSSSGQVVVPARTSGTVYPGAGIHFADLDADGLDDMIYIAASGTITAFKNQGVSGGKPVFSSTGVAVFGTTGFYGRDNFIVKDMDGDGKADLISINRNEPPSGQLLVYKNLKGIQPDAFNYPTAFINETSLTTDGGGVYFADLAGSSKASWVRLQSDASTLITRTNWCTYDRAEESIRQPK